MTEDKIIYDLKNQSPVEVRLLSISLAAFADQFKRYVAEERGVDSETRLFVHEVRSGSIIAELIAMGQLAIDIYEHREAIAGFVPSLADATKAILDLSPKSRDLDRATIRNVRNIYAPVAVDHGSQLNVIDNRGGTIINNITVTQADAAAIAHNANHLLNSQFPDEERFSNEPMTLFQMRNAPPGKTGDFGVIDRFSDRPQKLIFAADDLKAAILHADGNPFDQIFWIDGVVKTAGGKVAGYLIHALRDVSAKDD